LADGSGEQTAHRRLAGEAAGAGRAARYGRSAAGLRSPRCCRPTNAAVGDQVGEPFRAGLGWTKAGDRTFRPPLRLARSRWSSWWLAGARCGTHTVLGSRRSPEACRRGQPIPASWSRRGSQAQKAPSGD